MPTKLYIDGIIYSLQKKGGISILFNELIKRLPVNYCTIGIEDNININFNNQLVNNYKHRLLERLRPAISNTKCDIFHSTYYRIPYIRHKFNILTVHDFVNEKYNKGFRKSIHSYQKSKAINAADLIICVSNNTRRDLINMYGSSFYEKTTVIYNGVSNDFNANNTISCSNQILFVGNRGGYKNFKSLLIAMSVLTNYRLVCVGGGEFTKDELILINKFSIDRCDNLGYISNLELNQEYNKSFCLVYPSFLRRFWDSDFRIDESRLSCNCSKFIFNTRSYRRSCNFNEPRYTRRNYTLS